MMMYIGGGTNSAEGGGGGIIIPVREGVVAAYPLNDIDGGGTTVHDVINGHNGRIHGGAWWISA